MSPHYPSTDQGKLKAIAEMQKIKEFYCGSFVFETIFFFQGSLAQKLSGRYSIFQQVKAE